MLPARHFGDAVSIGLAHIAVVRRGVRKVAAVVVMIAAARSIEA